MLSYVDMNCVYLPRWEDQGYATPFFSKASVFQNFVSTFIQYSCPNVMD